MSVGSKPFRAEIVTPERALDPIEVTFVALPAWDGEVGVLAGRAPMVCKLGAGQLRLEVGNGWQRYYVREGFAEVMPDRVTVLTEEVIPAEELSADAARVALADAVTMPAKTEDARVERQARIDQAKAKIRIAEHR